ncbi:MAG TPA: multicopper oxidase domain-containing protein [Propionibacteriaceae bacterium]|nr:multicopper oxidase domain-containing protein [Propionibacteriaceae bacterium]
MSGRVGRCTLLAGLAAYHCHLIWHEDVGMMGQFTVVDPDYVESAPRSLDIDHDQIAAGHDHG